MTPYPLLLAPLQVANHILVNRIVMPPMVIYAADHGGFVTKQHLEHYKRRAGPGLVIVEGTAVLPEGAIGPRQLGIYSDRHVEGLSRLADVIRGNGAIAGIQIHHAGAKAGSDTLRRRSWRVAEGVFRLLKQQFWVPRLLQIREAFRIAASRAVEAGFDIVEIHGAHGYLFSQFLSPLTNWRLDRYGRSIAGRQRLLTEVFSDLQEQVAGRALVTCRLGVADGHRYGLSLEEGLGTALELQRRGATILDVSSGSGAPAGIRPAGSPFSVRLHLSQAAKRTVSIPVIGGGGIHEPALAEEALSQQMADLVFVGRAMLADPQWAQKTISGRSDTIVTCRRCRVCAFHSDSSRCPAARTA